MSLFEYIQQGGPIMYILLALNIIGFALMISKFLILNKETKNTTNLANTIQESLGTTLDGKDANAVIALATQATQAQLSDMEKGINTIKIIASISPLLGLLGTVIGVLVAFKVMGETGLNNPAHFAQGISMALITTVGGMIVAIPHYVGHNYLLGMLDGLESKLEKEVISRVI